MHRLWVASCSLFLVAGCSFQGGAPQTYPVSGKVLLPSGEPLSSGVVLFHPKDPPGNEAMGYIEVDGTFKMTTFGKEDGAIAGRYVVTIEPLANRAPGGQVRPTAAEARIPRRYWEEETSDLNVEVKAEQNVAELRLRN